MVKSFSDFIIFLTIHHCKPKFHVLQFGCLNEKTVGGKKILKKICCAPHK